MDILITSLQYAQLLDLSSRRHCRQPVTHGETRRHINGDEDVVEM